MKAGVFYGPRDVRVVEVPDPTLQNPADAIVGIVRTSVCGSDLWWYRGQVPRPVGSRIGHEFMGQVLEIGSAVETVAVGDLVVGPFLLCDGTCPECRAGISSSCRNGQRWGLNGMDGCQGERVRVPFADANLFALPKPVDERRMPAILALSDVMGTGHHGAVSAGVTNGSVVAVIGDGAVGLCAVLASKRLGAERIILLSSHEKNSSIGRQFGAAEIVPQRGDEAIGVVRDMTGTLGVDCVIECVGSVEARREALSMVRAGGRIGFIGLPEGAADINAGDLFWRNIAIAGGAAPTASTIPRLLPAVLAGDLDTSPIFDLTLPLAQLPQAYAAMDARQAIKVLITV